MDPMLETPSFHIGFDQIFEEVLRGDSSRGVSRQVLGVVLEDLAAAAPAGLRRSQLVKKHSAGSLAKALAVLGEDGAGLVRLHLSTSGDRGGRPAERYLIGSPRWVTLGIHVSVRNMRPAELTAVACGLSGEPLLREGEPEPQPRFYRRDILSQDPDMSPEETWKRLAHSIATLTGLMLDDLRNVDPDCKVLGLGIEVPGHVFRGEVLMADHSGYGDVDTIDLAQVIQDELQRHGHHELASRLVLENDCNLIAIREAYNVESPISGHGLVVAVFPEGVGAGVLIGKRKLYRGCHGGAGEPGHMTVFTLPGLPRTPERTARKGQERTSLRAFSDQCSCGARSHVDCFATLDRLLGQLRSLGELPELNESVHLDEDTRSDLFAAVAQKSAYDQDGKLTAVGEVFWTGGEALGHALLNSIATLNPDRLLVLLPYPLAEPGVLVGDGVGNGTAAGLYRQAMESVVKENAMTTTAEDVRAREADGAWRADGGWLDVQSLVKDEKGGADKAARNAAIGVVDAFIAHAEQEDECAEAALEDPVPDLPRRTTVDPVRLHKQVERALHEFLITHDPIGTIEAGAPKENEYYWEERALLQLIDDDLTPVTYERVVNVFNKRHLPDAIIRSRRTKLRRLTLEVADLQTLFTGHVRLRMVV